MEACRSQPGEHEGAAGVGVADDSSPLLPKDRHEMHAPCCGDTTSDDTPCQHMAAVLCDMVLVPDIQGYEVHAWWAVPAQHVLFISLHSIILRE